MSLHSNSVNTMASKSPAGLPSIITCQTMRCRSAATAGDLKRAGGCVRVRFNWEFGVWLLAESCHLALIPHPGLGRSTSWTLEHPRRIESQRRQEGSFWQWSIKPVPFGVTSATRTGTVGAQGSRTCDLIWTVPWRIQWFLVVLLKIWTFPCK